MKNHPEIISITREPDPQTNKIGKDRPVVISPIKKQKPTKKRK